jgi:sirohydrochlorin cobaltochelatase
MRRFFIVAVFLHVSFALATSTFAQHRADIGVLVIAHGSGETWNAPVIATVERVRARMPAAVGFLMGKGATPQQAYDDLVHQGASRIVVVPLLVSSYSAHAEQIRFLAGARPDYPHAEHMHLEQVRGAIAVGGVARAMDDDPIIADIVADRARALSRQPRRETFVLVAHGPNDDDEAAQWTAAMTRLVQRVRSSVPFRSVEARLLRDDAPKPVIRNAR